ncbi:MAG: alginate export family protein [Verrucomicrobiota bacterium]
MRTVNIVPINNPLRFLCCAAVATMLWPQTSFALNTPTNTDYVKPVAAREPAKPASAGLVNDWWREQSPAFSPWDIGGQFRLRYELKDDAGFGANNDFIHSRENDNDYYLLREKIHIGYTPEKWLSFFVEGRDASAHSDERDPSPDTDTFDLHQAFVSFGDPGQFPLSLKIGRQELLYGDERFVGVSDWGNTGRSFDAAKLRFENEALSVDLFSGRVVVPYDDHFNVANDYDWFSGIYASTRKLVPWQETQLYFLARNVGTAAANAVAAGVPGSPSTARDVYTLGTRLKSLPGKLKGWDYSAEVAGQFGSIVQSGVRRDLKSLAADATAGYTWMKVFGAPRVGGGYTYASGDSDPTDGKTETFEPLLGTNHKFYGLMDLWGLRNIHSGRFVASIKPLKRITLSTEYHLLWLADTHDFFYPESGAGRSANGYGRKPQNDNYVGSELDIIADCAVTPYLNAQVGYGHFFVGDYIRQSVHSVPANGGPVDADWFYAQIKFNF